jgi:hypothetical protein
MNAVLYQWRHDSFRINKLKFILSQVFRPGSRNFKNTRTVVMYPFFMRSENYNYNLLGVKSDFALEDIRLLDTVSDRLTIKFSPGD